MAEQKRWQGELSKYFRQGNPGRAERSAIWQGAMGLQDVDHLEVSDFLVDMAKSHIEGRVEISEVQRRIRRFYEGPSQYGALESGTLEADTVAASIVATLLDNDFTFSPYELQHVHNSIFKDIFDHAGYFRPYNITKDEWVLCGETVIYSSFDTIPDALDYDFSREKHFSYNPLSVTDSIGHIASFTSSIWQIHPFCEGNTRATAVFMMKYLKSCGFKLYYDAFAVDSWYFRNALVRANYSNLRKGIQSTNEYLELFLSNLLLGYQYELRNRDLYIEYSPNI